MKELENGKIIFGEDDEVILQLTKTSQSNEIETYFRNVSKLYDEGEDFPVDLDEVWMAVYDRKDEAVRDLKKNFLQLPDNQLFHNFEEKLTQRELQEGFDYKIIKESSGGRPVDNIFSLFPVWNIL